jgi:hypothetical protein
MVIVSRRALETSLDAGIIYALEAHLAVLARYDPPA